jgi:hypothetical protein
MQVSWQTGFFLCIFPCLMSDFHMVWRVPVCRVFECVPHSRWWRYSAHYEPTVCTARRTRTVTTTIFAHECLLLDRADWFVCLSVLSPLVTSRSSNLHAVLHDSRYRYWQLESWNWSLAVRCDLLISHGESHNLLKNSVFLERTFHWNSDPYD